jgi:hypothetical protein
MRRWHEEVPVMVKQTKVWDGQNSRLTIGTENHKEKFKKPLGRFRKRHALDCGKSHCQVCHYEKVNRLKKQKDIEDERLVKKEIRECA